MHGDLPVSTGKFRKSTRPFYLNDMADASHVAILEKGVLSWNAWRAGHEDVVPDLSDLDMTGRNLDGIDFRGAHLERSYLTVTEMEKSNLDDAWLSEANLTGADLTDASLARADLSGADLSYATLTKADLSRADLSNTRLVETILFNAILRDCRLVSAYMKRTILTGADLTGADVSGLLHRHAVLDGATLPIAMPAPVADEPDAAE